MSNYPLGVTGSEFAIAGSDYEREYDEPCPECGGQMMEAGYRMEAWVQCPTCRYQRDLEPITKWDYDPRL